MNRNRIRFIGFSLKSFDPMPKRNVAEIMQGGKNFPCYSGGWPGQGFSSALSLILVVWRETPALSKIIRFREHLEWADSH